MAPTNEHVSLRTLIDLVPNYLWIKDLESRFVVVNKALAVDNGLSEGADMKIGLSDFDIHSPEAASSFRAIEMEILATGRPMIDFEERIVDRNGACPVALLDQGPGAQREQRGDRSGRNCALHHLAQARGRAGSKKSRRRSWR